MNPEIVQLDQDGKDVFPVTKTTAIYDNNNKVLQNVIGATDISNIGDGTITGSISELNSDSIELRNSFDGLIKIKTIPLTASISDTEITLNCGLGSVDMGLLIIVGHPSGSESYISAIINYATSYGGNLLISSNGANVNNILWDGNARKLKFNCIYGVNGLRDIKAYFIGINY